jgi:hypothetical protein
MPSRLHLRPYTAADKEACLALFASNMPTYFCAAEIPQFAGFLDKLPCPYFLVEDSGEAIGCGGYCVDSATGIATLIWGIVRRDRHRQGIGTFLLRSRLAKIAADPAVVKIVLNTSQHTTGFFEREGFVVHSITLDGYYPGLHRHDMELLLDSESRARIPRGEA